MANVQTLIGGPTAAQRYITIKPRSFKPNGTQRWVVWLHYGGVSAYDHLRTPGRQMGTLLELLGDYFPILIIDGGTIPGTAPDDGTSTCGNATGVGRVADAVAWCVDPTKGGGKTDKVILGGSSQGATGVLNYAKANPAKVAALFGILPLCDLDAARVANVSGLRALIDANWGVTYPTALPAGANPATDHSGLVGIPVKAWYTPTDNVATQATVTDLFVTSLGGSVAAITPDSGHGDASAGAVPVADIVSFLLPYAA